MSAARVPLFVRLPRDQAAALDRLADATGRPTMRATSARKPRTDPVLDVLHDHALVDVVEKIVKPSFVKLNVLSTEPTLS